MAHKEMVVLIVVVPIIGLCVKAGFWQLDRADQKENLMQDLTVNETLLSSSAQILVAENQRGTYRVRLPVMRDVREPLVFLDNRIQERVVGYEVFTRVSSIDGAVRLLVNLGWVPGSRLRSELPEVRVPESFVLKGALVPVTESYLMTGSQSESMGTHRRVQSLTDLLSARYNSWDGVGGWFVAPQRGWPDATSGPRNTLWLCGTVVFISYRARRNVWVHPEARTGAWVIERYFGRYGQLLFFR